MSQDFLPVPPKANIAADIAADTAADTTSQPCPQVTICLTVREHQGYAKQAIASILKQTFTDFELIICEAITAPEPVTVSESATVSESVIASSTITAPSELTAYLENIGDSRIQHHQQYWTNRAAQRRSGFAAAQGQYFVQLDEKHRFTPDYLARTVAVLKERSDLDFVSTGHWLIDGAGRRDLDQTEQNSVRWGRTRLGDGVLSDLVTETFVHQSLQLEATLFRQSVLDEVDYLRLDLEHCEDSDLLVRLALAGKQAYFLSARLMEYRLPTALVHDRSQGLQYLRDKVAYLNFFQFAQPSLEQVRQQRLAKSYLMLGLRQLETEEVATGRRHIWQGRRASWGKAIAGLALSYMPRNLRQQSFAWLRQSRASQMPSWTQSLA